MDPLLSVWAREQVQGGRVRLVTNRSRHILRRDRGNGDGGGGMDQFAVLVTGSDKVRVRGGVWQRITRDYVSGSYVETRGEYSPDDSATVTWTGDSDAREYISDEYTIAATARLWAKLDCSSTAPALTLHWLTSTPTWAASIYWVALATVTLGMTGVDTPEQHHQGSIVTVTPHVVPDSWTTLEETSSSADTDTWRSAETTGLKIYRWRIHLDSAYYLVKVFRHEEQYDRDGRLLYVGAETLVDTLDLDPVNITVLTAAQYDVTSHQLQVKSRTNVKVLSADAESGWTEVVTFQPCPT